MTSICYKKLCKLYSMILSLQQTNNKYFSGFWWQNDIAFILSFSWYIDEWYFNPFDEIVNMTAKFDEAYANREYGISINDVI